MMYVDRVVLWSSIAAAQPHDSCKCSGQTADQSMSQSQLEDGQEAGEDAAAPQISRQLLKLLQPRSQAEHQVGCLVAWQPECTCLS